MPVSLYCLFGWSLSQLIVVEFISYCGVCVCLCILVSNIMPYHMLYVLFPRYDNRDVFHIKTMFGLSLPPVVL